MTLLVSFRSNDGIVMASDSRVTFFTNHIVGDTATQIPTHFADTTYKTFVSENNVGISISGESSINNSPISGYIEEFLRKHSNASVDDIPHHLMEFFKGLNPSMKTIFHVAGFSELENHLRVPKFYRVYINEGKIENLSNQIPGFAWNGVEDILTKLVHPLYNADGSQIPNPEIPLQYFTLQDAIDFAKYAINTTSETMRFQNRPQTVGGPIDILVIRPNGSEWLARKEIHS